MVLEFRARCKNEAEEKLYWRFKEEVPKRRIQTDSQALMDAVSFWLEHGRAQPQEDDLSEQGIVKGILALWRSPDTEPSIKQMLLQLSHQGLMLRSEVEPKRKRA